VVIELFDEPSHLRRRIAERTRWMFEHGLLEETAAIVAGGGGEALRALRAIGYDEALACLDGRASRQEAERSVNLRTARLAKRQRTWFRHQVRAHRLDTALEPGELLALARSAWRGEGAER
jgi:tRNA dimethylallyltransferase